jgi:hypothetical protein
MKIAGIGELRSQSASLLGGSEPILVTRYGRISGVYLPLENRDNFLKDIRRELLRVLGRHLDKLLVKRGVTEKKMGKDFEAHRRGRR